MKLVVDTKEASIRIRTIKKLFGSLERPMTKALTRIGEFLIPAVKPLIPRDTSAYYHSLFPIVTKVATATMSLVIGSHLIYGKFLEYGTRPHWVPVQTGWGPGSVSYGIMDWVQRRSRKSRKFQKYKGFWMKRGIFVTPHRKGSRVPTGKKHFVPFDLAPDLLEWAHKHRVGRVIAIWVWGVKRPHWGPTLRNPANVKQMTNILREEMRNEVRVRAAEVH